MKVHFQPIVYVARGYVDDSASYEARDKFDLTFVMVRLSDTLAYLGAAQGGLPREMLRDARDKLIEMGVTHVLIERRGDWKIRAINE